MPMLTADVPLGRVKLELGMTVKLLSLLTEKPTVLLLAPYRKARGTTCPVLPPVLLPPSVRTGPPPLPLTPPQELIKNCATTIIRKRTSLGIPVFTLLLL